MQSIGSKDWVLGPQGQPTVTVPAQRNARDPQDTGSTASCWA